MRRIHGVFVFEGGVQLVGSAVVFLLLSGVLVWSFLYQNFTVFVVGLCVAILIGLIVGVVFAWPVTRMAQAVRLLESEDRMLQGLLSDHERTIAKKSEMLGNFVYYTAHRLRTPLNIIRWSTDILKSEEKGRLTAGQREVISGLEASLISVIELSDDLLDSLSFDQKQKSPLKTEREDLHAVVDEAAGDVAVLARERHIQLDWKPNNAGPIFCHIQKDRLVQAVKHVLKNAILYNTDHGSVTVRLRRSDRLAPVAVCRALHLQETRGHYVFVVMTDTGIGIPFAEQPYIFERFFRGKRARSKWVDGAGLGLALTRAIVAMHGGAVWFYPNAPGKGTTFVISLPTEEEEKVHSAK